MMSEETMDMRDEDRLPWLEAVEEDDGEGLGLGKLLGLILLGVVAVALVVAAAVWLGGRDAPDESGELIAAPEEDYRVRPPEAGGMEVEGEGDAAFAASEGENPDGRIDPSAVPEEPVAGRRAAETAGESASAAAQGGSAGSASARIPESGGRLADAAPRRSGGSARPAGAASGTMIQLGAFSSEAAANRAWSSLSGRYNYLSSLDKSVSTVEAGGRTLYRLRAAAGSAENARTICGRLRVATEDCSVVVN